MRSEGSERRRFLKSAGLVVPGLALAGEIPTTLRQAQGRLSAAKGAAEMGHPNNVSAPVFYDVRVFGATGDGRTIDTPAINRAIDAAATGGGGTVYFRAGNYLCYSIHLKSKVAIYLDAGATIVAADPASSASPDSSHRYDL